MRTNYGSCKIISLATLCQILVIPQTTITITLFVNEIHFFLLLFKTGKDYGYIIIKI